MKKILAFFSALYIWLVAGSIFLSATIFGAIIFNIIPSKKVWKPYNRFLRLIFILSFVKVHRNYEQKFEEHKGYIFMPNHSSLVDVPLLAAYIPAYTNAIEANSHFKWPIYKHLIKAYGQIPIDRKNPRKSLKAFEIAADRLNENTSILVFPEGTRTKDGKLRRFKKLPFLMAKKTNSPIVPIGIKGVWKMSGNESFFLKHTPLTINYGKEISPEEIQTLSIEELSEKVRAEVTRLTK